MNKGKKILMGRVLVFIIGLLLFMSMAKTSKADEIMEPQGNSFYVQHRDECLHDDETYYVNAKEGYIKIYDDPTGKNVIATEKNEGKIHIYFTYEDKKGKSWGIADIKIDGENKVVTDIDADGTYISGWVAIEELTPIYSEATFYSKYKDQFKEYNGEFKIDQIKKEVYLWEYPGSQEYEDILSSRFLKENEGEIASYMKEVFLDEEGLTWVKVNSFYKMTGWICTDDPENASPKARAIPKPSFYPIKEADTDIISSTAEANEPISTDGAATEPITEDGNSIVVVIGLLAGAVVLTILITILIKVLYQKKED